MYNSHSVWVLTCWVRKYVYRNVCLEAETHYSLATNVNAKNSFLCYYENNKMFNILSQALKQHLDLPT